MENPKEVKVKVSAPLTQQQILRYSRHLIMPEVGIEGQQKLLAAKVLLIGSGGLGSPASLYLAAAGVGTIGLVDFDNVDFTNLHRQIVHDTANVGKPKIESAKARLLAINPDVKIETYNARLTKANVMEIFQPYDLIIDGTDNFPTRYLVNDACVFLKKPNVYGSIFRFEGQATLFVPGKGPCYRCLYPEPPPPGMVPSCAEGGVLGILPGVIGVIQATEAVKWFLGVGEPLMGRLLLYNALTMKFREMKLKRDPQCPVCSAKPTITELIDYEQFCGIRGEEGAPAEASRWDMDAGEVQQLLGKKRIVLLDVREPTEYAIGHLPHSHLIPLGLLPARVSELDTADEIVAYCHHGTRSLQAVRLLDRFGFKKLHNLRGGIDAWSTDVDPAVPRY